MQSKTPIQHVEPGATLPNGAVIIAVAASNRDGRVYVLAVRTDLVGVPRLTTDEVYATWACNDAGTATIEGHYFDNLSDAIRDLTARVS